MSNIEKLSSSSSLKDLVDRQELLTNNIEEQKNTLKEILISKNVEVADSENKLSILIDKVGLFDEYIPPILYVYNQGDSRVNFKSAIQSNFTGATFDFQKNSTNMVISTANSNSTGGIITGITESYIDVTNYSKINFEYEVFSSGTVNQFVFFSGNALDWDLAKDYPFEVYHILENISVNVAKNGVATLNISNQTGNKGIGFRLLSKNATSCYCKITKIWLEK